MPTDGSRITGGAPAVKLVALHLPHCPGRSGIFGNSDRLHARAAAIRDIDSSIRRDFHVAVNAAAAVRDRIVDRGGLAEVQIRRRHCASRTLLRQPASNNKSRRLCSADCRAAMTPDKDPPPTVW